MIVLTNNVIMNENILFFIFWFFVENQRKPKIFGCCGFCQFRK